jgi:KTSC domain
MPVNSRSAAQQRTAKALRKGTPTLPKSITGPVRTAIKKAQKQQELRDQQPGLTEIALGRKYYHKTFPGFTSWPSRPYNHHPCTDEVWYDRDKQTLDVKFYSNKSVYRYTGVPWDVAEKLVVDKPGSTGDFLNDYIKGAYSYRRVS